ncbi:unnamed protein product [Alopecurus aequalis]
MAATCKSEPMVGGQFCAPQRTVFTLAKSHTLKGSGFKVTSSGDDAAVTTVETTHIGFRNLRSLRFLDAASGRQVIIEELGTGHLRSWESFRVNGTGGSDLHFVAVDKTCFFQMGLTVHVFLDGNVFCDRAPDFVVSGSYHFGAMTVSRGGGDGNNKDTAATINRKGLVENKYTVMINAGVDQAFVLALTVILDQMYDARYCACYRH